MQLYVGNLPYSVTEENLREAFGQYGEIASVSLVKDRATGQSKGFGFVEMPKNSEADAAIKGLNGKPMGGRMIKVNQAEPKKDKPRGGPRRF